MVEGNRRFYIVVSRQPIAVKLVMTGGVNMNLRTPNTNDENTDNQALWKRGTDVRTPCQIAWMDAAGTARYSNPIQRARCITSPVRICYRWCGQWLSGRSLALIDLTTPLKSLKNIGLDGSTNLHRENPGMKF